MGTKTKVFLGLGVVVAISGAVAMNLTGNRTPTTTVEAEKVRMRRLISIVEASGQIEPSISVDISSDVIGRITRVGAEEGDWVEKGQFLIQVDPTQLEQRVVQFEAAVDSTVARVNQAEASLEQTELEFERKGRLWAKKLVPEADFDAARVALNVSRADLSAAEFGVNQARASLQEARDTLAKTTILAPMDGIVIRKNAEVGEVAISGTLNNAGSLLMTIADLSAMETEVEVDETDVVDIRLGQKTEIELDAFPDQTFTGIVTEIANSSVLQASSGPQQSANYKVKVRLIEMPDTIRPGLSATARITTAIEERALSVPIQSLTIRQVEKPEEQVAEEDGEAKPGVVLADTSSTVADHREVPPPEEGEPVEPDVEDDEDDPADLEKEGVFVIRDDKVVFVPVEIGTAGEKHFEITGDVEVGDLVVSGPFSAIRTLKDGDAVKIKDEDKDKKGKKGAERASS